MRNTDSSTRKNIRRCLSTNINEPLCSQPESWSDWSLLCSQRTSYTTRFGFPSLPGCLDETKIVKEQIYKFEPVKSFVLLKLSKTCQEAIVVFSLLTSHHTSFCWRVVYHFVRFSRCRNNCCSQWLFL